MHVRTLALAVLLLASPAAADAQRPTADYQKAVEEAVAARRSGQAADQAAEAILRTVRIPENEVLSAIREAGYQTREAVSAAARTLRLSTDRAVPAMAAAGFPVGEVATAYRAIVRSADELANGLRNAGIAAYEATVALEVAGFEKPAAIRAVTTVYSLTASALATEMRAQGQSAVAVGEALEGAGYSVADIGAGLRAAGYDAIEIAASLQSIGLELAATAAELRRLGYDIDTMANALVQAYGPLAIPLVAALKAAGGSAQQVAAALDKAGLTLQQSAEGLRAAGYATAAVGAALIAAGNTAADVGSAMKIAGYGAIEIAEALSAANVSPESVAQILAGVGFTATETAAALAQHWNQSAAQLVATLRAAGYDASQAMHALMAATGIGMRLAWLEVARQYGLDRALAAAEAAGVTLAQATAWSRELGADVAALIAGIRDRFEATAAEAVTALVAAGYSLAETANAVYDAYAPTPQQLASMLAPYATSAVQLTQILVQVAQIGADTAAAIVANIMME